MMSLDARLHDLRDGLRVQPAADGSALVDALLGGFSDMTRLMKFCAEQLVVACMLCGTATAQTAQNNDELELAFNGHCRECHAFDKGDNRLGPSLYGVVGRKAGTAPNFAYFSLALARDQPAFTSPRREGACSQSSPESCRSPQTRR